ncbi:MAG: hypothetical protein HQK89_00150 [Nitrospirae bacterium]|nr:hypothetical protein [Nitrospirota bacterium]
MKKCERCESPLVLKGNFLSGSMYKCIKCETVHFIPTLPVFGFKLRQNQSIPSNLDVIMTRS